MAEWQNGGIGTAELEEWRKGRKGPSALILVMRFSVVILLSWVYFLNRTLLGGVESLRSESGI